jgi:hypothetical protein
MEHRTQKTAHKKKKSVPKVFRGRLGIIGLAIQKRCPVPKKIDQKSDGS